MCWDMSGQHSRVVTSRGSEGPRSNQLTYGPIVCFTELEAKSMLDKLLAAELLDIVVLLKTYFGFSFQKCIQLPTPTEPVNLQRI